MNIQYIFPTRLDENNQPIKYRKALLPPLTLAILDGLTPPGHRVKVVNDIVEEVDFSDTYDLVAITAFTTQAMRAYQIADRFRKLGVKVIMGGVHATVLPQEAKQHADAVFIGEMGRSWSHILADAENNRLREFYQEESLPDLKDSPLPRWDHMKMNIYFKPLGQKFPTVSIFTTRGCPFQCTFCSVSKYFGRTYRTKPIDKVIAEIDSTPGKNIVFVDDNIAADPDYSGELFKALIPKKIRWYSQVSTTVLKSPDLVDLAAKSGCDILLVGIESFNKKSLRSIRKGFNQPEAYGELFARLRSAGIIPLPTFIFGLDDEPLEQFQLTIDTLMRYKIGTAMFCILTPFPGTELFQEMHAAGRIISTDWTRYDLAHVVFQPLQYPAEQFYELFWKYYRSYFTWGKLAKRLFYLVSGSSHPFSGFIESLYYLLYNRKQAHSFNFPLSDGWSATRGTLFEKTVPLDPLQKLLIGAGGRTKRKTNIP